MPDAATIWKETLPVVRNNVTGVGIWAALNNAVPIALEDGTFVLGLAPEDGDLAGHLRMPQTKRMLENELARRCGGPVSVRIIDGDTVPDWERAKRRDAEARRLQEMADSKSRAETSARSNWEGVYEQLSRRYAALTNKSLPQTRARFLKDAVAFVAEALNAHTSQDDLNERNFGRCIERISQYSEVPSTLVAALVLEKAGKY